MTGPLDLVDRLAKCGTPQLWQRIHASLVVFYFVNLPAFVFFVWLWLTEGNDKPLLIQLAGLTVITAIESSMAGLHASAVQEKQEEDSA